MATDLYAVVAPGLERVAADELRRHGFTHVQPGRGGVRFSGSALGANRRLAIPTRVLQRVARFKCFTFEQLEAGAAAVDWAPFGGVTPRATCRGSRLYHSGAVEERLTRVVPEGPTELLARIHRDHCSLSVDTSGPRLHLRCWRVEGGAAPLRETLAAGILALAGWRPGTSLYDPMCGSGTLLVEAAVAAAGRAPGGARTFACERWCPAEPIPELEATATSIGGRDRRAAAVETAGRNAGRAQVEVTLEVGSARDATPPSEHGLLVCNPPYGRRARGAGAAWGELVALLSGPFAAWDAAVLCPASDLEARLERPVKARHPIRNGGLKVNLLLL